MRMLIDARHQEETRVAVVKGNRIEEFDFESAEHKQLKGNIYLAKVTRVEPSLQAAFVDYGGNRHGFLAFSEIHPDYYQIPKEDREALLREEAEHAAEEERLRAAEDARYDDDDEDEERSGADEDQIEEVGDGAGGPSEDGRATRVRGRRERLAAAARSCQRQRGECRGRTPPQAQALRRRYKIQDVIRRRQVLLVQVVKEERGNKGAALTTYLSLAGRYCVLMPNTSMAAASAGRSPTERTASVSRQIMADLALPSTMGCIVRTAGLSRTKVEIKRDFDYLARLWDEIRENTLKSQRRPDLRGQRPHQARDPRHLQSRDRGSDRRRGGGLSRRPRLHEAADAEPRPACELYSTPCRCSSASASRTSSAGMYQPVVQLKSGGYLVINPTEALVSIDINSGRSTARAQYRADRPYATNIERRTRSRASCASRHGRPRRDRLHRHGIERPHPKVEKAMKEALKNDRARIQVGRISSFG
jgi:ribonuclease E